MKAAFFFIFGLFTVIAAPAATLTVTNATDGGAGSLRVRVQSAASGDTIVFAGNLSGQSLTLTNEIVLANSLTVDSSTNLPGGITLRGSASSNRLFSVSSGQTVSLIGLTFTGGGGVGAASSGSGGAILNDGTLKLTGCTFYSNSVSGTAGAILNDGAAALTNCTLAANTSAAGGALFNAGGALTVTHCTLVTNSTTGSGGAIYNGGSLTLVNSILSGNTATGSGKDLVNVPGTSFTTVGANIAQNIVNIPTVTLSGPAAINTNALLAPLGNYGGPTKTMPPLLGSPAIDAAVGSLTTNDQRGLSRPMDGDDNGSAVADLGAVEKQMYPFVVTNLADSGAGTLRQAVSDAASVAAPDAALITFDPGLNGQTNTLASQITVNVSQLFIDARSLASGFTVDGGGSNRIFRVSVGKLLVLSGLSLRRGAGYSDVGNGGAVLNYGTFTAGSCLFQGNTATNGGAIFNVIGGVAALANCSFFNNSLTRSNALNGAAIANFGTMTVLGCAFMSNFTTSPYGLGGAIYNESANLTLVNSTLFGNSSAFYGGAINSSGNNGLLTVTHCTIAANSAGLGGGGIDLRSDNIVSSNYIILERSIVAGNTLPGGGGPGPDIFNSSVLTVAGTNIVPLYQDSFGTTIGSGTILNVDPLLGPLTDNGGPTLTMALLPGSPALDGGGGSTQALDQRGYPRNRDGDGNGSGVSDIGAVEMQTPPANGPEMTLVTTAIDELDPPGTLGSGMSLREAVRDLLPSGQIRFDPAVFDGSPAATIVLSGALSQIYLANNVTISATNIPGGVTIQGGAGAIRIFRVETNTTVSLFNLTLTGGKGYPDKNIRGGAIYNDGTLALTSCNVISNQTAEGFGGAILNNRSLTMSRSTFAYNSSLLSGGAVNNFAATSTLTASNCTFYGNKSTTSSGGGLANINSALATLAHCTIVGNSTTNVGGNGGGIFRQTGTVTLVNSIVTSNTAPTGPNLDGTITSAGVNLTSGNALLAPLANNGGGTLTMALLSGSPALNAATGSTITNDQRGFPIIGVADVGAYELQLGSIPNATTNEDNPVTVSFNVGAVGTLNATSSVPSLVQSFAFSSSGGTRNLTVTPAANENGSSTITVFDSEYGGAQSFSLAINPVNDAPSFTALGNQVVLMNAGPQTVNNWATFNPGPANESGQTVLAYNVANDNNALFSSQPAVSANGTLTYTPAPNASGRADIFVSVRDNGGTANGGVDTSATQTFVITVFGPADFQVANGNDFGAGSLRQALDNSALLPGSNTVTFAPAMSGQTILIPNPITITDTGGVGIDGSGLSVAVTLQGAGTHPLFGIAPNAIVGMTWLNLTGGVGSYGGAIENLGTLSLTRCALYGNINPDTLFGGGAILNQGVLTLTQCTLTGNSAATAGGAIDSEGPLTLTHCTVSGNSAASGGGVIVPKAGPTATINRTIVAGNMPDDILGTFSGTTSLINVGPLLAPLGDYGGGTLTMALLPGSPARNAAIGSTITSDQRGFPIVGPPDIGAYEAGTTSNYNAWIWETLQPTGADHSANADPDGDGMSNLNEWLSLTDPGNAASVLRCAITTSGTNVIISFPSVSGRNYALWRADSVTNAWVNTGLPALPGNGAPLSFTNPAVSPPSSFFRVQAGP